jgi:hypothetical protein
MKNEDPRSWPSEEVIGRYLRGKASPEETYHVEKTTLEHPFFADALRGYVESGEKPNKKDWTPDGSFFERKYKELQRGIIISFLIGIAVSAIYLYLDDRSNAAIYVLDKASTTEKKTEKDPIELDNFRDETILEEEDAKDSSMSFNVEAPELNDFPKKDAFVRTFTAPEPLEPQPTELIDSTKEIEKALTLRSNTGNIYHIADYKVVDYRGIRTVTTTSTEVLTGTPAAQSEHGILESRPVVKRQQMSYVDYLEKTMFLFAQARFKEAQVRFDIILNHYPNDANALFYSGLCHYYLEDFKMASVLFLLSTKHPVHTFHDESVWYNGLSMWNGAEKSDACKLIQTVASGQGFYAVTAKEWLETNQCP